MTNVIEIQSNASVCDIISHNTTPIDQQLVRKWKVDDTLPLGIPEGDYVLGSNFGYRYEYVYTTVRLHPAMTRLDILLLVGKEFVTAFCVNDSATGTPIVPPPNMTSHEVLLRPYDSGKDGRNMIATPFVEIISIDNDKKTIETFIGS